VSHRSGHSFTTARSCEAHDDAIALRAYVRPQRRSCGGNHRRSAEDRRMKTSHLVPSSWLRKAYDSARSRARSSRKQFSIGFDDIQRMCRAQRGRCAVSGLPFSMKRYASAFVKYPFRPSLDRIKCGFGYKSGNVRIVCTAVNFGLGQWGDEVFRAIAEATVRHQSLLANQPASALDERISAAEAVLPLLSKAERRLQKHRIAGLKRARTTWPRRP